ncbi:LysR family transcriptional regulator [Silvimonas sp. JCM 19000]
MQSVDLNLLPALEALLTEMSVTRAARRLGLSPSAMSRTLTRLRSATGDPLLVQAGRNLVLTPYAEQLRDQVQGLAQAAQRVLQPARSSFDPATLQRTFTLRANDGLVDLVGATLLTALARTAPHVCLRFTPKFDKDAQPLRDGAIDLEIGTLGTLAPEIKTRLLFEDRFVGICRVGHPLLAHAAITAAHYVSYPHVVVSRKADFAGPVDMALEQLGLRRTVALVVPNFANAMQIVGNCDALGLVSSASLGHALASAATGAPRLQHFELPVATPTLKIAAIWHPRFDADPAHRWLRDLITRAVQTALPTLGAPR